MGCLNYRIDMPDKIGSISSGTTTSMVVQNGTKKTFEGFLNVLNVLNMSHGNGSSALVSQVMGILKPVTDSTDKMLQLSHLHIAGCNSLYGSNFGHPRCRYVSKLPESLKKIANLLKNMGIRAISVRGVFNKKIQICSNILRSYMICS